MNIKMPKMRNFELNQQLRACGHKVVKDKKKWSSKNQCRGKVKFQGEYYGKENFICIKFYGNDYLIL